MDQYKKDFIQLLLDADALKFGSFTLKSGREAPYFLNAGAFYTGELIHKLGGFYAEALRASGMQVDVLFGPAYKGIPLCVITASEVYSRFGQNVSYTFNRKAVKNYGDAKGNMLVGAPLSQETRVVLVDDVITAGTAIRETVELLKENGNPKIEGILIAFNRMEKNNEGVDAVADLQDSLRVPVHAIVNLDEAMEILPEHLSEEQLEAIAVYREKYGV